MNPYPMTRIFCFGSKASLSSLEKSFTTASSIWKNSANTITRYLLSFSTNTFMTSSDSSNKSILSSTRKTRFKRKNMKREFPLCYKSKIHLSKSKNLSTAKSPSWAKKFEASLTKTPKNTASVEKISLLSCFTPKLRKLPNFTIQTQKAPLKTLESTHATSEWSRLFSLSKNSNSAIFLSKPKTKIRCQTMKSRRLRKELNKKSNGNWSNATKPFWL